MRPRFGGHDTYSSYQPTSYATAEFPSSRRYYYYGPSVERKGICPITNNPSERLIPAVHVALRRRPAPAPPQPGAPPPPPPPSLKHWGSMALDTDGIVATMNARNRLETARIVAECREGASKQQGSGSNTSSTINSGAASLYGGGGGASSSEENWNSRLQLILGQTRESHATDFLRTCIYGPGGSSCSGVASELIRDSYIFLARKGYCQPIAVAGGGDAAGRVGGGDGDEGSGGTVRATFSSLLNPLLDPTMSCPAINNLLPQELRIFRRSGPTEGSDELDEVEGGGGSDKEKDKDDTAATQHQQGTYKATTSSSFLFSKNPKVFKIRPSRPDRMEKPVRRGATVTIGGRLVPSLGGSYGGGGGDDKAVAAKATRARRKAGASGGDDDEDVMLAVRFGGTGARGGAAAVEEDEFAIVDATAVGAKRDRDGNIIDANAPVDDGGDGVESNGGADTNSLSSFSGDDDDNEDMSDGGGSGDDELYL